MLSSTEIARNGLICAHCGVLIPLVALLNEMTCSANCSFHPLKPKCAYIMLIQPASGDYVCKGWLFINTVLLYQTSAPNYLRRVYS